MLPSLTLYKSRSCPRSLGNWTTACEALSSPKPWFVFPCWRCWFLDHTLNNKALHAFEHKKEPNYIFGVRSSSSWTSARSQALSCFPLPYPRWLVFSPQACCLKVMRQLRGPHPDTTDLLKEEENIPSHVFLYEWKILPRSSPTPGLLICTSRSII